MKRFLTFISVALCLLTTVGNGVSLAQAYDVPPVTMSKDKVRSDGKIYYSHVVEERQTLFSIAKAYKVSVNEILEANPTLNLEKDGLKKNQVIMIPMKEEQQEEKQVETKKKVETTTPGTQKDDYFIHVVKWFEDIKSIAENYKVSVESIVNINGLQSDKLKRRQSLKIPYHPEMWENKDNVAAVEENNKADESKNDVQNEEKDKSENHDVISFHPFGRKDVSLSLLLPFKAQGATDALMMDFYFGSLIAARDLGKEGTNLDLNVYDAANGSIPITRDRFAESNFTIGPVASQDIVKAVRTNQNAGWIVSPLEPKAEALADTLSHILQAPTPVNDQIEDMVNWINSEHRGGDKVILIIQSGIARSAYANSVVKAIERSGIAHSNLSFSILEGRNILGQLSNMMSPTGTNRVIMASDSEAFAIEVVRNLYLLSNKGSKVALFSTAKIRTFDTIDLEQIHNINLHASVSYFINYESDAVKKFVQEYRAVFNAEPTQFSFQGYDLTKFFSTISSEYGNQWESAIEGKVFNGLQADFKFKRTNSGSYVNEAVKRVIYTPDYKVVEAED